jgi:hypothetical protein
MIAPAGGLKQCTECGKCCTYVSVEINPPRGLRDATDILWYLYHENVSIYRDGDGEWSVVFETRCRNLQTDLLCGIYPERPHICRDFDNTTCDVNDPVGGLSFESAEQFLDYLKARRPALYRRVAQAFVPQPTPPRPAAASAPPPAPSGAPGSSAGTPGAAPPGHPR